MGNSALVRWLSFSFRLRGVRHLRIVVCFVLFPLCVGFGSLVMVNGIACVNTLCVCSVLEDGVALLARIRVICCLQHVSPFQHALSSGLPEVGAQ